MGGLTLIAFGWTLQTRPFFDYLMYNKIVLTLTVIVPLVGAGCATTTHVQHEVALPNIAGTVRSTRPQLDPNHMAHIGNAYYPNESRAIPEEGICKMEVTIEQDGRVSASHLVESSKFARLDAACENAFPEDVRFIPATKDGTPIKVTVTLPIVWCLGVRCAERLH
jgi:TonB family protein